MLSFAKLFSIIIFLILQTFILRFSLLSINGKDDFTVAFGFCLLSIQLMLFVPFFKFIFKGIIK